jgi:hypothetical protein
MMTLKNKIRVWCKISQHFSDIPFLGACGHHLLWLHTGNEISLTRTDDPDYVVQRYTEMNDVDGDPIFEGDIVEFTSYEDWDDKDGYRLDQEVRWSKFYCGWAVFPVGYKFDGVGVEFAGQQIHNFRSSIKVIGNIFQKYD